MLKGNSWGRMVLAFMAVLVVAGAGTVYAVTSGPGYSRPKLATVTGPGTVSPSSTNTYTLTVTFVDGTSAVLTAVSGPVTFSASTGVFDATGDYTAPSSTGKALITGRYTSAGATVTANRAILIQ
jgi:hypothetical protein